MQFEWDPNKAARNLRAHKVSFEEASTARKTSCRSRVMTRIIPLPKRARSLSASPVRGACWSFRIRNGASASVSSAPALRRAQRESSMKKTDLLNDDLRPEYRREDFGPMVRGKYAVQLKESSNIVVLDPEIAEAFPNTKAVNDALRGLLELARTSTRLPTPTVSTPVQAPQQ